LLISAKTNPDEKFALKVIDKHLVSLNNAAAERRVLELLTESLEAQYFVNLIYAFQNDSQLFYVTEFCPGGDLLSLQERTEI